MRCATADAIAHGSRLGLSLIVAIACLLAALVILRILRRQRSSGAALLVLLIVGAALTVTPGTPARAAPSDCPSHVASSLTITQTSATGRLGPGIAPLAITGLVVNNGPDSAVVAAVVVTISSVTPARNPIGPVTGICTAGDYLILHPSMTVGRSLEPGESMPFAGAFIGFNNKSVNQDACQHTTVHLLYTAHG